MIHQHLKPDILVYEYTTAPNLMAVQNKPGTMLVTGMESTATEPLVVIVMPYVFQWSAYKALCAQQALEQLLLHHASASHMRHAV